MVDIEQMAFQITPKFEAKGKKIEDLKTIFERQRAILKKLWDKRLDGQITDVPDLEDVIRETNRIIQRYF